MKISGKDWDAYINRLSRLSQKARSDFSAWVTKIGGYAVIERQELLDYVYALVTKYGEGSAALAASFYDQLAAASGATVPAAEAAATASYAEAASTVNGVLKKSANVDTMAGAVERLVKMPGVDTTLRNAIRDGAEVAWVPHGDTCAFCIALASRGWQRAGRTSLNKGHAEHIHGNCDCTYAVRFNSDTQISGYNPDRYSAMYYGADGNTLQQRINSLRREFYAENSAEINAQKRIAYQKRAELNSSAAEEMGT